MADAHSPKAWKGKIEACRKRRDRFVSDIWQTNVAFRVQRPFSQTTDDAAESTGSDQVAVPADWSRSRAKGAAMFSQVPRISLEAKQKQFVAAVPVFERIANHFVPLAGAASVMEECNSDVINAAGICAAIAKYEATFEEVEIPMPMPGLPPEAAGAPPGMPPQAAPELQGAALPPELPPELPMGPPPMQKVMKVVSERYRWYRISPAQLLWPVEFRGSDWQRCPWLGYDATMPWARAMEEFKLTEDDKRDCCTTVGSETTTKTLSGETSHDVGEHDEMVRYSEIYYWASECYPDEKRFEAIRRIVFVHGRRDDEPVIDEEYTGQQWVEQPGEFVGVTRLPIEVATLTYVSDRAVPPSDSEIGRPQVLEQIRSRSQMIMQRTRNLPIRTADSNRIDPLILDSLMKGTWQGIIPTNGPGDRAITQVAAAAFPKEDFSFDAVSNRDLDDAWSMSPNQMGNYGSSDRTATEASQVASAYASVLGFQRGKIVNMFLGLVTTTLGLLQLNLDDFEAQEIVGPDGVQQLQAWNRKQISGKFVATVRQDATVLQDSGQRVQQLMKFLNIAGKSGRINIDPILQELAALSGLDPAAVLLPPPQPKMEQPNLSWRFSGAPDVHDPIVMGFLIKAGQAPGPQEIAAAKKLIADGSQPFGPNGEPMPSVVSGPVMTQPQLPPGPQPPPEDWEAMPRVTKRPEELGG
jgi:hypothetical protein